jgi:hypothetical protein
VTPDNHLWVADYPGKVWVFDLSNAQPPFGNLTPVVAPISTGATCRADELGYDPRNHVTMVGHPAEKFPFASFIFSEAPYQILGTVQFPGVSGLEQPLWDSELRRFLVPVPDGTGGYIAVIKVDTSTEGFTIENKYAINCNGSGLALAPFEHLLVGCGGGKPLLILNAQNGNLINTITQIPGADEVWYNAGDGRFYAASSTSPTPVLGIIDRDQRISSNRIVRARRPLRVRIRRNEPHIRAHWGSDGYGAHRRMRGPIWLAR